MNQIMNIGASGLRAAEARAQAHAINIVNANIDAYLPLKIQQTSSVSGPRVKVFQADSAFPVVDIAEELVDLEVAKQAFRASALIIRKSDELTKALLDVFA